MRNEVTARAEFPIGAMPIAAGLRGSTGATLLAHGFSVDMLADLVHEGLATAHREPVRVDGRMIKVARVRITNAGRIALA